MRKMLWAEWKKLRRSSIILITIFATVLIAFIVLVAGQETTVAGFYLSDAGWYMTMAVSYTHLDVYKRQGGLTTKDIYNKESA